MGGKDKFVMAPRHGTWFDQLIRVPGIEVPDGQTGAALVVKHRRDRAVMCIDVIGWGSSTLNMLQENEVQCHSVNGATKIWTRPIRSRLHCRMIRNCVLISRPTNGR
jgi:hypothetical protein